MSHSEEFQRALVDEALNRTPTGGFPELEERDGLRPGTLFDWVERLGPARPALPFSSLHVWLGTTPLDLEAFGAYFDHDPAYWSLEVEDIEAAEHDVTGCGLAIDLGERFLPDEDLLHVLWRPAPVPVRELVDETTLETDAAVDRVVDACAARGVTHANAGFTYADPEQAVRHPDRLFHGLAYLGLFASQ